jgi:hypothetical protein
MCRSPTLVAGLIYLWLLPAAAPARAEDDRTTTALAALNEGNELLERGEGTAALAKFQLAFELSRGSPNVHFNFGQAYRAITGRELEAYESFQRFLDQARDASPRARAEAERESSELRRQLSSLRVETVPPGARVIVDSLDRGASAQSLILRPGVHTLRVELGGYVSAEEHVRLAPGAEMHRSLTLALKATPGERVNEPPAPRPPPPPLVDLSARTEDPPPPPYRRWWFWAGVAGVVGGAAAAFLATRGNGGVVHMCPPASQNSTGICDSLP